MGAIGVLLFAATVAAVAGRPLEVALTSPPLEAPAAAAQAGAPAPEPWRAALAAALADAAAADSSPLLSAPGGQSAVYRVKWAAKYAPYPLLQATCGDTVVFSWQGGSTPQTVALATPADGRVFRVPSDCRSAAPPLLRAASAGEHAERLLREGLAFFVEPKNCRIGQVLAINMAGAEESVDVVCELCSRAIHSEEEHVLGHCTACGESLFHDDCAAAFIINFFTAKNKNFVQRNKNAILRRPGNFYHGLPCAAADCKGFVRSGEVVKSAKAKPPAPPPPQPAGRRGQAAQAPRAQQGKAAKAPAPAAKKAAKAPQQQQWQWQGFNVARTAARREARRQELAEFVRQRRLHEEAERTQMEAAAPSAAETVTDAAEALAPRTAERRDELQQELAERGVDKDAVAWQQREGYRRLLQELEDAEQKQAEAGSASAEEAAVASAALGPESGRLHDDALNAMRTFKRQACAQELCSMGFDASRSSAAAAARGGDVGAALDLLLQSPGAPVGVAEVDVGEEVQHLLLLADELGVDTAVVSWQVELAGGDWNTAAHALQALASEGTAADSAPAHGAAERVTFAMARNNFVAALLLVAAAASVTSAGSVEQDLMTEELYHAIFAQSVTPYGGHYGGGSYGGYGGHYGGGHHHHHSSPSPSPQLFPSPSPKTTTSPSPSTSPETSPSDSPQPSPSPREEYSVSPAPEADCAGIAYDGYLSQCTAYFDVNQDRLRGDTEPVVTIRNGLFSLIGYSSAQLGALFLVPAPGSAVGAVTSDSDGICYDIALQQAERLPLATPKPATCNDAIVMSPLTSLLVYGASAGLTADALKAALGVPASIALGTSNVLKSAIDGSTDHLSAYIADMEVKAAVTGTANLLTIAPDKYAKVAAYVFTSLAKLAAQVHTSGRRLHSTLDLADPSAISSLITSAQTLAAAADPSAVNITLTPDIISAVANALAAINTVAKTSTDAAAVQKAGMVASTKLAAAIQGLVNGTLTPAAFSAATSPATLAHDVQDAVLPGPLDNTGLVAPQKKSKAVAIGVGVGVGLGVPLVCGAAFAYYWFYVKPNGGRPSLKRPFMSA
eukprot:scaffold16.g124.t1